ncbi:MAG: transglycosylase domain-containing protein, partial [Oscillospiraceae bacterium]|nr:transglycosylase domain-containing protein [Oscillospiraceae bacterium]
MRSSSDIKIRKRRKKSNPVLKTLAVIGTTFLSLFLIVVITLCIVATALTVYVIKFMENSESVDIDLYNLDVMTTSFIYAEDPVTGEQVEIHRMSQDANRILVSLDEVPQHVRDAFISTEDERFYEHEGVDFKRTFLAFANYFLHFWDEKQGGSTITQQL